MPSEGRSPASLPRIRRLKSSWEYTCLTTYIRWCLDSLRHWGLFKPQSACCIAEFPLPVPPPPGVCVSVCVCEQVSESLRFYYLSASPGEVWSSCSVFFTSLAIFSSHCGSYTFLGLDLSCGSVDRVKPLSTFLRRRKLIKLPASPSRLHLRKSWPSWAFPCGSGGMRVE